jgi:hypothetical protein
MSDESHGREALLMNLRNYAHAARLRLALHPSDAERLADLPPGALAAIEEGSSVDLPAADLRRFAETLGLTDQGTPVVRRPPDSRT